MMAIGCGVWGSPSHGVPLGSAVPFIVFLEDRMRDEKKRKEGKKERRKMSCRGGNEVYNDRINECIAGCSGLSFSSFILLLS
jgi:hypothetical protein